jgi:hypothetical protein
VPVVLAVDQVIERAGVHADDGPQPRPAPDDDRVMSLN